MSLPRTHAELQDEREASWLDREPEVVKSVTYEVTLLVTADMGVPRRADVIDFTPSKRDAAIGVIDNLDSRDLIKSLASMIVGVATEKIR